jgi:small-conductance mechanosensitive channel
MTDFIKQIAFINSEFLTELAFVALSFLLCFLFKRFFDKKFLSNSGKDISIKNTTFRNRFIKNYRYVSYPLYLTFILTILFVIFTSLSVATQIIVAAAQFSIIWLVLRVITAISGSKSPKMIVIIIGTILLLDIFHLKDIIVASFDELSINFGAFRFSSLLIVEAIIAIIVSLWVINLVSRISHKIVSNFTSLNISAKNITIVIIDIALYSILFIVILTLIGFDVTAIAVVGSAIGIGFGFGLQKITSNFISGLILLFERSIKEGDVVELSSNPEDVGFIKRMGIRYTLVRTFDNKEIMMPNEDFITNKVTNWTFSDKDVRINIKFGVSYNSDLNLVKKLALEAANENIDEETLYKPVCFLQEFGDSSVNFLLHAWVSNVRLVQNAKRSDILFALWNKFKENNIEIPFPQQDLHIKSSDLESIK